VYNCENYINFLLTKGLLLKIISRLLLSTALCATLGFSGIITGVSVIINDEPITLYEVYKYSEKYKISRKESLNMLVKQKLEDSQIKKMRINADIFEVDKYIENMANKNGLSQYEFLNMLKSKDVNIADYKAELKEKIKRDKLYRSIYGNKLKGVEDKEMETFYKEHPEEFKVANSFNLSIYTAQNPEDLKAIQNNPMLQPAGVNIQSKSLKADTINAKLKSLLNATKEGTFTQVLTIENKSTMFYVKQKTDFTLIPYEDAKKSIYRVISKQKEEKVVKDYFEKLKSSATIKVVRSPS
jgi:hypothetical protein